MSVTRAHVAWPGQGKGTPALGIAVVVMACLTMSCQSGSDSAGGSLGNSGGAGGLAMAGTGGVQSGAGGSTIGLTLPGQCTGSGYSCLVPKCTGIPSGTTVSGKVYDPSGKLPIYGAVVYIPDQPDKLADITQGPGNLCGRCVQPSGTPVAGAVTGPDGSFVINQAPVGRQIPLVVQLGKWRRMTFVDVTNACANNAIVDSELTRLRLPRKASDGEKVALPKIAIATGAGDRLQCLLLRMGIDPSEFTNPDGAGSINIYNQSSVLGADPSGRYDAALNNGVTFPDASALWSDINQLSKYDISLLACGGNQVAMDPTRTTPNPITDQAKATMVKYLSSGGRVLGEHYHSAWIKSFPAKSSSPSNGGVPSPLGKDVASWFPYVDATDATSSAVPAGSTVQAAIDTSFTKGQAFAAWLVASKAAPVSGTFPLVGEVKRTVIDQLGDATSAQRWLYQPASASDPTGAAAYAHALSFNLTSSGEVVDRRDTTTTNLCGRFVYTGLHVDSGDTSTHASDLGDDKSKAAAFPSCCATGDLNPAEKAIAFMLLDLSSCLSLDAQSAPPQILF
jgi:hypothetical protein